MTVAVLLFDRIRRSPLRQHIIERMTQPMTARQMARQLSVSLGQCSHSLRMLDRYGLASCLNGQSVRSRVYWLTAAGQKYQRQHRHEKELPAIDYQFPIVDWDLYGWVCHSHRSAVIKALVRPMQPSEIKRRALQQNPNLKMSANNVRDIIRLFLAKGIVRPVLLRKKKHPLYDLMPVGKNLRQLLHAAHTPAQDAL